MDLDLKVRYNRFITLYYTYRNYYIYRILIKCLNFQMDLSLKDHIVILDEAHNIEDCARDAGGINITKKLLEEATYDLHKMGEHMIKDPSVSQRL